MAGPNWLNLERVTVYPRILVVMFGLAGVAYGATLSRGMDFRGQPLGSDFITFWAAGYLALQGRAADAYAIPLIAEAERVAVPGMEHSFAWFYPPSFHVLVMALALAPYGVALAGFLGSTLAGYLAVLGRAVRRRDGWWVIAAFPGVWLGLAQGQTGFLTASLAGGALMLFPRRPVLAGVLIGLLVIKPQLALGLGVALLAIGAWTTLLTAALVAASFMGAAVLILGPPTFTAWLGSLQLAQLALEAGALPWAKSPSVFAAARLLWVPVTAAYVLQAVVAALVVAVVVRVWRSPATSEVKGSAAMLGTFLITPYAFDYDLVWLAFPVAWLALAGLRDGWLPWEREVMLAGYVLPVIQAPLAVLTHLSPSPLVLWLLLWCALRRTWISAHWSATIGRSPQRPGHASTPDPDPTAQ